MLLAFCRYFGRYIFFSKTRQWLLFLAVVGLFISSLALIVLQSTMSGMQSKQIERSKDISGDAVIELSNTDQKTAVSIREKLIAKGLNATLEYELELLLKYGKHITPTVVHGIATKPDGVNTKLPDFLEDAVLKGIILPIDLSRKLRASYDDKINLISPGHQNHFLGEIPRSATVYVDEVLRTNVPEIDMYHSWVNIKVIQNLIRKRAINKIRIYGDYDYENLRTWFHEAYPVHGEVVTWEQKHKTLVWALGLESTVMLFLFVAMTMLVSLCITSGLLILYDKVKNDLASFWILGATKKKLEAANFLFLNFFSLISTGLGLLSGIGILLAIEHLDPDILPAIFVEQKLLIKITPKALAISFFVPYAISLIFSWYTFSSFKRETNYLEHVRSIGG